MRRLFTSLLTLVLLITLASSVCLAEDQPQSPLQQKVSYDKGYTRLHYVIEELSSKTGVKIACGRNRDDWHVRDVPVTIYVKDIPLRKLLEGIAEVTHLSLVATKLDSGELSYRLLRDKDWQSDAEADKKKLLELEKWKWDALVEYAKTPAVMPPPPGSRRDTVDSSTRDAFNRYKCWVTGTFLAALGPAIKDKVFAGDIAKIDGKNPACREAVKLLYKLIQIGVNNTILNASETPTKENLDRCEVKLCLTREFDRSGINISIFPVIRGDYVIGEAYPLPDISHLRQKLVPHFPPPPVEVFGDTTDEPEKGIHKFGSLNGVWDAPALHQIVKLEKHEDKTELTHAEILDMLFEATGYNIIAEDFDSHLKNYRTKVSDLIPEGKELKLKDIIFYGHGAWWSIDDKEKLILSFGRGWKISHESMVSESLLTYVREKLDSDGFQCEDMLTLRNLSPRQRFAWFGWGSEFEYLNLNHPLDYDYLWQLYFQLNAADKALAKNGQGFPLAKLDREWLVQFLKDNRPYVGGISGQLDEQSAKEIIAMQEQKNRLATDADYLATLIMRVDNCNMTLSGNDDGEPFTINLGGLGAQFPIYSPKRAEELKRAADNRIKAVQ